MAKSEEDLKGKLLFFAPNEEGSSYFTDSLIYICDHNENGSLGLIFNRPLNLELKDLLKGMQFTDVSDINGKKAITNYKTINFSHKRSKF